MVACCGFFLEAQSPQNLSEVKTIFVDSLGEGASGLSAVTRDKIITLLVKSRRFQVVRDPDKADATLTGAVTASRVDNGSGGSRWDARATVRLITKDQRVLWRSEASNGELYLDASSRLADVLVKDLLRAIAPPKKQR
jgi:hypothetical protein